MSYKVSKSKRKTNDRETIKAKTRADQSPQIRNAKWWKPEDSEEASQALLSTFQYLKQNQQYRFRKMMINARLYGNMSIFNFVGQNMTKINYANNLPIDRPTMNVVQSCVDTLTSQITQNRPRPVFQTDDADYKERNLAKQLNNFINGEMYQTKAYDIMEKIFKDAAGVTGTGCIKILEKNKKVALERTLSNELFVDENDGAYGAPRAMIQAQLWDRDVACEVFPDMRGKIMGADSATIDSSTDSSNTVSDKIIMVEGWHLPSGKGAKDGRHMIACSAGNVLDEKEWKYVSEDDEEVYIEPKFPFVFFDYSPMILGFWAQSLTEQLMGTQIEINKLLQTISASINLVGVPRVFVEDGSKVVKAHLNNQVGSIVTYRGTKPQYEVAPCVPQEVYAQLQRLVEYAYQQAGVSQLSANGAKPAGLNSGEAQREYNDRQTDRFAALSRRYDNIAIDLAYQMIDLAKEIAKRDGKYETVYVGEDKSATTVDLPKSSLLKNPFVIQCADASMLPRDPAGRKQEITEMMQSGMITMQEGRRLLNFPDLEQSNKLAIAAEEKILKILDEIVENGKSEPADPMMDLQKAVELSTQYYNYYTSRKLEDNKAEMIRTFRQQALDLIQASQPPTPPAVPGGQPQAVPQAPPVSDILPNSPQPH